jgi:anti-anti-sigma regulatory factor
MQSDPGVAFAIERTQLPDGSVRLTVAGGIDAETSCDLLDWLVGGIVPGRRLVVDLAAATEVDETGLAALAVADRLAQLHQATLQVVTCTGDLQRRPADPAC